MISIIIPTWNEGENIKELAERLNKVLKNKDYEVIIVDNLSNDDTRKICLKLAKNNLPLKLFSKQLDLANAVLFGFKSAKGDIICVMDGDLSHPPEVVVKLLNKLEGENCDLVVATRRKQGGKVENWPIHRKLISRLGEIIAKPLVKHCSDPLSGFFMMRRSVIDKVNLNPLGYKILLEILVKGKYKNYSELPYTFENRKRGSSKLNAKEYLKYFRHLARLYLYIIKIKTRWFIF